MTSADPFNPKRYVSDQLNRHAPPAEASSQYDARVKGKNLLLVNPLKESRLTKQRKEKTARREKHKARKRLGIMGRKEAKCRGIWTLDPRDAQ